MVRAHAQGQGRPWISPFLSKSLLGWLSHFLSCWSHPWKGFEVWSVFDVSSGHAKASPGDSRLSQACANGFLSQRVCQAVVFLCSLFDVHLAWCLIGLTQCLAGSRPSFPMAWYGNPNKKYVWNSPLSISRLFPSSHSISFSLPSTMQTFARYEEISINWNKTKQISKAKKR